MVHLTSDSEMLGTHRQARSPGTRAGGNALEASGYTQDLPLVAGHGPGVSSKLHMPHHT